MAIPTSRTDKNAEIIIDRNKCNLCGICVDICKDFSLKIENNKLVVSREPLFGCFGCGQCAAVCPSGAIVVEGRTLSAEDFIKQPHRSSRAGYNELYNLLVSRRSIRDFKNKPVEQELIDKILNAASTAPMGIPPSDTGVLVFKDKLSIRSFSFDFINELKKMKKFFSPFMLAVLKPSIRKADYELSKSFLIPLVNFFEKAMAEDKNYLLYDAPLVMYFYNKGYADPADPYIAATYAMIAAHSLGLGCCMIGSIVPFLKSMKKLKAKYNIPAESKDGIFLVFGYPEYKFQKAVKRTFAEVNYT